MNKVNKVNKVNNLNKVSRVNKANKVKKANKVPHLIVHQGEQGEQVLGEVPSSKC